MEASPDVLSYVRQTAALLDLPLAEGQAERITLHLARTRELVATLSGSPLGPEDELAEIYCPAPFPAGDAS